MRRRLDIRVTFAPTRLSAEHLRVVYDVVTPLVERRVVTDDDEATREQESRVNQAPKQRRGSR
jgi:hypothetical protein